jgi:hypothetical protein
MEMMLINISIKNIIKKNIINIVPVLKLIYDIYIYIFNNQIFLKKIVLIY